MRRTYFVTQPANIMVMVSILLGLIVGCAKDGVRPPDDCLTGVCWKLRDSGTDWFLWGVDRSDSLFVAVGFEGVRTTSPDGVDWTPLSSGPRTGLLDIHWSGDQFVAVGAVSYLDPPRDACLVAVSVDGSEWSFDTLDIVGELFDVTWTGSQLIAVGGLTLPVDGAAIVTSPDGSTWTERPVDIIDPLLAVGSVDGTIIAVGFDGAILTSDDGIEWIERDSGVSNALYGITSSDERIVVVGTHGTILSSP